MDVTQSVLLAVIVILAILFVFLGVQVYFVLKDLRTTLKHANHFFSATDELVTEVKKPISAVGNIIAAVTAGAGIAHILKRLEGKHGQEK